MQNMAPKNRKFGSANSLSPSPFIKFKHVKIKPNKMTVEQDNKNTLIVALINLDNINNTHKTDKRK